MGRLRRAMPMHVHIYICWQLELSGNANLRLYQCWFAFTHRSTIKNFASCRLREKILQVCVYAKMVELRARLSLLVDKTTFQYNAFTIHYTTIDRRAPLRPQHPQPWRKGRPGRAGSPPAPAVGECDALDLPDHPSARRRVGRKGTPLTFWITPACTRAARSGREERDALDAPGSAPPHARQGRKKEGTTDAPGSPAPAAEVEGMPLTFWITPSASTARGRHRVFSNSI